MTLETGYENRGVRLEMIPLMDVVFLLLVFFIYAMFTMAPHLGIQVDLPRAEGRSVKGEQMVITLAGSGIIQLDGRTLTRDDAILEAVDRHRAEGRPVLISADRAVPLGVGIELLAQLQAAGVDTVTFQVTPEGRQP
jgi:biopolymer transport protein ExbD